MGTIARTVVSTLCNKVLGIKCGKGDKVVVTKFCDNHYNVEAEYSPDSWRLQNTRDVNYDTVNFPFILQSIKYDEVEVEGIESLLSTHLQCATLSSFLVSVLADILASNSSEILQSLTAVYYTAVNAVIDGLGLYYPIWGYMETCLSINGLCISHMFVCSWIGLTLSHVWFHKSCRTVSKNLS